MKLLVLHLSDIHINGADDVILERVGAIAATAFSELPSSDHVAIVVSGDIAFSGTKSQYEIAEKFLRALRDLLLAERAIPVDFITTPGNHDCNFQRDSGTRRHLLAQLLASENPEIDDSVVNICTEPQTEYFHFRESLEGGFGTTGDALWRSRELTIGEKTIRFESVNMAWLSQLQEKPGKLYFPAARYESIMQHEADLRLLITHQPFNWLNQYSYRPIRKLLRSVASVIFTGHEHISNSGTVDDQESGQSAFVEGGVLQSDGERPDDSSFNIVTFDLANASFSTTKLSWNGSRFNREIDADSGQYRGLPVKRTKALSIQSDFSVYLDDPGGPLTHPSKACLSLADIFVYPDLRRADDLDRNNLNLSGSLLRECSAIEGGVVISGDEKSGRSTLLRHLFREYYDNGFYPLLLNGETVRRADEHAIAVAIANAVVKQYGKDSVEEYNQIPKSSKVIFIDDFESTPVKAAASRQQVLASLTARARGVILVVDEYTDIRELTDADGNLSQLEHYKLQPFGYVLRSSIVAKWYSLGDRGSEDDYTMAEQRNQAETLMSAVVTKHLVPASPLYLLTILQSVGAGHSGEFKDGALGYYYQYLLTRALQKAGVKPGKLTEQFQYCTHLAWEMHQRADRSLSNEMMSGFNQRFSDEWQRLELHLQLDVLARAGILVVDNEGTRFRYSYIYYYFKGQYLSQSLNDLDTQAYVRRCCDHLYVRDNAYTILFLAHHSNDEFVLRSMSEALHKTFMHRAPTDLDKDTSRIAALISDAPKLIYKGGKPEEHRQRRNRMRDELDSADDGLFADEVEKPGDHLATQVAALFKTTEILGHVLKNQYAKISRAQKAALLDEMFDGPLRALGDFYSYLEKHPDSFVQSIERAIERTSRSLNDDAIKQLSRKFASTIILAISVSFLMRAASSASAKELMEDVEKVVKKRNSISRRLIEVAIALDGPSPLPRKKLQNLQRDIGTHLIAARSLQYLVVNRLYMFPIREADMQWLANEMGVDLEWQHRVIYRSGMNRRLK
jgi:hypothetical protein